MRAVPLGLAAFCETLHPVRDRRLPQEYQEVRDSFNKYIDLPTPPTSTAELENTLKDMPEVVVPNGTPRRNTFSLTEYTTTPSPTTEDAKQKAVLAGVPEEFLLPTRYPDVRIKSLSPFSKF